MVKSPKSPTKVLIFGLDDSGKTSILLTLKMDTNILSFCKLKPTKGLHIENIDTSLEKNENFYSIWDFGGQAEYRENYMVELDKYLKGVRKIIYVIDVQDMKRYDISLAYFKDIVKFMRKNDYYHDFVIFLHKYDPHLTMKDPFTNIDAILEEKVISKIQALLGEDFKYKIFKTSIYSVFEKIAVD